jgi:hypothetical protein
MARVACKVEQEEVAQRKKRSGVSVIHLLLVHLNAASGMLAHGVQDNLNSPANDDRW